MRTLLRFEVSTHCETGGDGGIRTLDTLERYDDLANRCLQPLGHVSSTLDQPTQHSLYTTRKLQRNHYPTRPRKIATDAL